MAFLRVAHCWVSVVVAWRFVVSVCPGDCGSVVSDAVWCEACWGVVRRGLWLIPAGYRGLEGLLGGEGFAHPLDGVRVSGSRERRSPSVVVDVRSDVFRWVELWERDLRGFLGHGVGPPVREGGVLQARVEYLGRFLDDMLERVPEGEHFGLGVLRQVRLMVRLLRAGPQRQLLSVPCPFCGRRCLVQHDGPAREAWFTVCQQVMGGCGRVLSEMELEWLIHATAG